MKLVSILFGVVFIAKPALAAELKGELGARLGWRQYEKDIEEFEYLIRPSFTAGLAVQFSHQRNFRSELGIYYKSVQELRKFESGLTSISGQNGYTTAEVGIKQSFVSIPATFTYSKETWFAHPFISIDGHYVLRTASIDHSISKDTSGALIEKSDSEQDITWAYKRFNLYFSPGVTLPLKGWLKKFEFKSSVDLSIFDAPKADTVTRNVSEGLNRVIFTNRFRMQSATISIRYKIL